jgi:molybdopterin/thiamine biosynthesis adenylyltransferase
LGGTDTQAAEALKLLAGIESALVGRLLMLDARAMEWTEMRVERDVDCTICRVRRSVPPGGTT